MGQPIQFAWEVTVSLWDLCKESAALPCAQRGVQDASLALLCPFQRDLLRYRQSWHCGRYPCCPIHQPGVDRSSPTSLRNHREHRSPSNRQKRRWAFTLITVFTSQCADFRDFFCTESKVSALLALWGDSELLVGCWDHQQKTQRKSSCPKVPLVGKKPKCDWFAIV